MREDLVEQAKELLQSPHLQAIPPDKIAKMREVVRSHEREVRYKRAPVWIAAAALVVQAVAAVVEVLK